MEDRTNRNGKISALDKYLIFSFSMIIIYTIIQIIITAKTGVEQSTLTTCFFGVFGGEIISCALIKRFKLKEKAEREEIEDG